MQEELLTARLYDVSGKLVFSSQLNTNAGAGVRNIKLPEAIALGQYQLSLLNKEGETTTLKVFIE